MLDALIRTSLRHRSLVLLLAGALLVGGSYWVTRMKVEVFPDLSAPVVIVITEVSGMAPEEVERLVTFPIESALNGTPGIRHLRSVSGAGISVVRVELDWGEDVYRARQIVGQRLQGVALPATAEPPELGPVSSIMGEIAFVAITSESAGPRELRRIAETVVRRALLSLDGVSQVVPIGGEVRQVEIVVDPTELLQHRATLEEVVAAAERASDNPSAGFHVEGGQEYLVRGLGRARGPEDFAGALVRMNDDVPLTLDHVAEVRLGSEPLRGTASANGRRAVVLSVQKHPSANTLELTRRMDRMLDGLRQTLPAGIVIEADTFRQADFIELATSNVQRALRDGAILVVVVLFFFLARVRPTLISALALPLSVLAGILLIQLFGGTLNTMTLGGLTIAVGALVDDAIIDVENVYRRLRQERRKPEGERRLAIEVVFQASSEVRRAILFATLLIGVVLVPLLFLPGLEGRLLRPLALAYVAALGASLVVSLTVTPVLCLLLLPESRGLDVEPPVVARLRRHYGRWLERSLHRWRLLVAGCAGALALTLLVAVGLPRSFLPPFNEGALTVGVVTAPGITLAESDAIGRQVEEALLGFPEVVSTSRRTGRAEKDEHVQGVNRSEIEAVLREGREKEELLAAMRQEVAAIPGVVVSFGQPISHRIDHMISGSRSNLAVKIFGADLSVLRTVAARIEGLLQQTPNVVDVSNEEQASVPALLIEADRRALARHGMRVADLTRTIEALFQGTVVGEILEDNLVSRVVVVFPPELREDRDRLSELPVTDDEGHRLRLADVATIRFDLGPSMIRREGVQRLAQVTANISGVDLAGTVGRLREDLRRELSLPEGYFVELGGQFEEAQESLRNLSLLTGVVLLAIYGLLYAAFRVHRHVLVVLVNLPLTLIGGILALWLAREPLSIAALVGFITLLGIGTRNGVLLVQQYELLLQSGLGVEEAVRRGSSERLAPILMTALTAALALLPLVLAGDRPGNEIQSPMGLVILGGLLSSTFLNLAVVPVLFTRWELRARRSVVVEPFRE